MRRRNPLAPLVLALPWLTGCGLCEQLTATRVVSASLVSTPELPNLDPTSTEGPTIPSKILVQVIYGNLANGLSGDAEPVEGAKMRLVFPEQPDGLLLAPDPEVPGTYCLVSDAPTAESPCAGASDPRLTYLVDQEYRLEITDEGSDDTQVMRVTAPTSGGDLDASTAQEQARGADLSLTHPDPENLAFITVTRFPDPASGCAITDPAEIGAITYTNTPVDLEDVKAIIQDDGAWHEDPMVVPGAEAFPDCGLYILTLSTMARGQAETTNLFIGSQFFAGQSVAAQYRVR